MKERKVTRWEYREEIVVFGTEERPKTLLQKIFRWIGELVLWAMVFFLPLTFIISGLVCFHTRHVPAWRSRRELYGDDALGFAWLSIALGIWGVGYGLRFLTGRRVYALIGWFLAILAGALFVQYTFLKK